MAQREREREREKLTQLTISYSIWPPFVVKSSNLRTYAFKVKDRLHMGGGLLFLAVKSFSKYLMITVSIGY